VSARNGETSASVITESEDGRREASKPQSPAIKIIRAEVTGSDQASACGLTVCCSSPILTLCRQLIAAGHDPKTPLQAYRGATLCLHVRSIREAAGLEIAAHSAGFRKRRRRDEDGAPYSDETPADVPAMGSDPESAPDPLVLARSTKGGQ